MIKETNTSLPKCKKPPWKDKNGITHFPTIEQTMKKKKRQEPITSLIADHRKDPTKKEKLW